MAVFHSSYQEGFDDAVISEQSPEGHGEGVNLRMNILCWRERRSEGPEGGFMHYG